MQDTKSLKLLKSLTKEEFRRLGKFLRSPFYSYNKSVVALYDYLKKYYPDFETKKMDKEKVWAKLFPNKAFNDNGYWNLCFTFLRLIEKFMVAIQMEAQPDEEKKLFIQAVAKRNLHDVFEKETQKMVEKIEAQPWMDIHSYSDAMWLKHDYFFNALTDKYGGAIYSVEDAMEELDRFYLLAKLRFASEIKNRERIFSKKVPVHLLDESITESKRYETENPAYRMYKNVLDLYDPEKGEEAFKNGKALLGDEFEKLSRHDQNEVMLNLRNYAIRQLNKGKTEYWREIFELYKIGLDLDLIIADGKMSEASFGNIVRAGCVEKEFEWTKTFIEDYEKYLDENIREAVKRYSLSTLYFGMKEYDEALTYIESYEFTHILHQANSRILTIKIWFEMYVSDKSIFSLLISKLESTEKYFRRKNILTEQKRQESINFILAIKNFADLIQRGKRRKAIKIAMQKYLENRAMISKAWIKEKIHDSSIK